MRERGGERERCRDKAIPGGEISSPGQREPIRHVIHPLLCHTFIQTTMYTHTGTQLGSDTSRKSTHKVVQAACGDIYIPLRSGV